MNNSITNVKSLKDYRNLEAVLLDLDNTLILFDEKKFFDQYSRMMYTYFSDIFSPEDFGNRMMAATYHMIENDTRISNLDKFMHSFGKDLSFEQSGLLERFDRFYDNEFQKLKTIMSPVKGIVDTIESLNHMNLKLVVATNPMLPMRVQQLRLKWAGLDHIDFVLITSVENSSYCKPDVRY